MKESAMKERIEEIRQVNDEADDMINDLLDIVDFQTQKITELHNGKSIGSLHHQIVSLEVKNKELHRTEDEIKSWLDRKRYPYGYSNFDLEILLDFARFLGVLKVVE